MASLVYPDIFRHELAIKTTPLAQVDKAVTVAICTRLDSANQISRFAAAAGLWPCLAFVLIRAKSTANEVAIRTNVSEHNGRGQGSKYRLELAYVGCMGMNHRLDQVLLGQKLRLAWLSTERHDVQAKPH